MVLICDKVGKRLNLTLFRFILGIKPLACVLLLLFTPQKASLLVTASGAVAAPVGSILAALERPLYQKNKDKTKTQTETNVFHGTVTRGGIVVDLQVQSLPSPGGSEPSRAKHSLRFRLSLRDTETGSALTGLHPSAWMNLIQGDANVP
jgi:hypothetical protein